MLFFIIFTVVYSPMLAPILIQIAHADHRHIKFMIIGKQSYENKLEENKAFTFLIMTFLQTQVF